MFDNPTDNHTDIEVPLYYKLRFTKLKRWYLYFSALELPIFCTRPDGQPRLLEYNITGTILGMGLLANERWRCKVKSSLIGWAHTQNDPCIMQ